VKVMIVNSYEMILITLGLALSVYKDDFFTLIYQFMMQGLLYFSIQDMGAKVGLQVKISKVIIGSVMVVGIIKSALIIDSGLDVPIGDSMIPTLKFLGIHGDRGNGVYRVQIFGSFFFELFALLFNCLLLNYYIGQSDMQLKKEKRHYINSTLYLFQYQKLQHLFLFFLVVDTFFSQTFIQLSVLCKKHEF